MSAAVLRMLDAAEAMGREPHPFWIAIRGWLIRVAMAAAQREPWQPPAVHAQYLATGERADAIRAADAYLTAIREGATP